MIRTVSLWIRINGKFSQPLYPDNKQTRLKPQNGEFPEPSRDLAVEISGTAAALAIKGQLPLCAHDGTLAIEVRMAKGALVFMTHDVGKNLDMHGQLSGREVGCRPVVGKSLSGPACWQVWRVPVEASPEPRAFEFTLTNRFAKGVELAVTAHFVPE